MLSQAAASVRMLQFSRPKATIKKQLKVLASADVALERVACPVLVVTGEADTIVPPANSELVMAQLVSDLPCNIRREAGQSLLIGGSSLVILQGKACNPL